MLYNTFIIINNNWKRAMSNGQNNIVVDEQGAKNLQQAKDTEKTVDTTETPVKEDQGMAADDQLGVILDNEDEEKEKSETIGIINHKKVIESNIAKVAAAQCATIGASALVGLSNPIGLMICVAIAFKKLTASTKDIEFEQNAGEVKKIGSRADEIVVEINDKGDIKENDPAEFVSNENNPKKAICNINGKTAAEVNKLFSEEEQKKCAETGKVEISEDKAKKLSKILERNIKAGTLDFSNQESIDNLLGNESSKIIKELKNALNPKISENTKQSSTLLKNKIVVEGRGV